MKSQVFNNELQTIENEEIRKFTELALNNLPDYFYEVPASSTGKYHPQYALGKGGLVRHTKSALKFANYILGLQQSFIDYTDIERDCIRSAVILHDGFKHGTNGGHFTTHEHPQTCADWIINSDIFKTFNKEYLEIISNGIASHMGQWNTSNKSSFTLHKPVTNVEKLIHICDYLASRKDIEILFDESESNSNIDNSETIETYTMIFGKYKGQLLTDVIKKDKDYLRWLKENANLREPLKGFINQVL